MSQFVYMGYLSDIGLGILTGSGAELRVRPEVESFGPVGIVSATPVPVPLGATGGFTMSLYPSGELTPSQGGSPGVDYILELARFETAMDGQRVFSALDTWKFTAVAGGGNVGRMQGGSLLAVWLGPPWPSEPLPKGLYIDLTPPNEWTIVS